MDQSGKYRFENVVTSSSSFSGIGRTKNYKLLLYPNGDLSTEPEEKRLNYRNLPGQLNPGKSAFIITAGASREYDGDSFLGEAGEFKAGAGYYFGLTDQITLAAGTVYDESLQGYGEIYYQPVNFPLTFRLGALGGEELNLNGDISYSAKNLRIGVGGDEDSANLNLSWRLNKQLTLLSRWRSDFDDDDDSLDLGFSLNLQPLSLTVTYDYLDQDINGSLRGRFDPFLLGFRKYDDRTSSELAFNLSGKNFYRSTGNAIRLTYDTDEDDSLGVLSWFYRSPLRAKDGRSLLDLELGYGIGTQGSGVIASASTTIIPGLGLRLTYRQVGLTSDDSSLSLGLFTSVLLQPNREISSNEQRLQKLRAQGGIFIKPFLDKNNNGKQDKGEDSYTDDLELLFLVNNQPINRLGSKLDVLDNGAIFELPPDNYRLDLDSAGFPIGWKAENLAYAVKVAAGSYTKVPVPLIPSYVLAGQVTNGEGKPLGGLKVEAVSVDNPEKRVVSITNRGGIYYLEGLERTKYNLFIDGKPAKTNTFEIKEDSDTFLELNLQKSDEIISNK